jgi:hypothetical protein
MPRDIAGAERRLDWPIHEERVIDEVCSYRRYLGHRFCPSRTSSRFGSYGSLVEYHSPGRKDHVLVVGKLYRPC